MAAYQIKAPVLLALTPEAERIWREEAVEDAAKDYINDICI